MIDLPLPLTRTITTIIIIRHPLCLDRLVSPLSNNLFKDLTSRLLPTGLQFSIILGILLLSILVTCRNQFALNLLSLSSNGLNFKSYKIYELFLWSKRGAPGCSTAKFHLVWLKFLFWYQRTGEITGRTALMQSCGA